MSILSSLLLPLLFERLLPKNLIHINSIIIIDLQYSTFQINFEEETDD